MKGFALTVIALAMTIGPSGQAAAQEAERAEPARPRIEVVFVLDTTGSMSGLIQGAKDKIWSIANTLASGRPAPEIKMGLVAYRDRGDEYVTRKTDLTDDLDAVYSDLMELQAQGGGDTPESVNQALHEAVTQIAWSKDDTTYRVIYLVGDCPPHMDYEDDVKYPETCKAAAAAGIIINTIQCGGHGATTPIWREIADRAEGAYFRVEQSGGVVAIATPFDERMAELAAALEGTRIYYGTREEREALAVREVVAAEIRATAPSGAAADRAAFFAGEGGKRSFAGRQELVTAVADGELKLEELSEDLLPEDMQKMTPEERAAFIQQRLEERERLQQQIAELNARRRAYIEQELRKGGLAEKDSFDKAIFESVREQAAEKGIVYEEPEEEAAE